MIQDNQKSFSRLQMLIDAVVIAAAYVVAWMIRFIGPFAYSAVRALAFEQYMFALIFIIPGYLLLYQAFTCMNSAYAGKAACACNLTRQMCWDCFLLYSVFI